MQDKTFAPKGQRAVSARFDAQKIAFGPVVFQCVRYAWKRGVLHILAKSGERGLSLEALVATGHWSSYSLKIVLDSCLSSGVVSLVNGCYVIEKIGYFLLSDKVTQVNFDFMHDVCYLGMFELEQSLDDQIPHGLKTLGDWPSIYEGLSSMPEPARSSWFAFDHYYSDTSFQDILADVLATHPKRVMDVGANTGKFACALLQQAPDVEMHLIDLPSQLTLAEETLRKADLHQQVSFHAISMLDIDSRFPSGMDLIWMSQFLSCFSESVILSILRRAVLALSPGGELLILDTLWDRQRDDVASFCLMNTSPYFTAMASGNSKIYMSQDYIRLAKKAGLKLITMREGIGYCHSLLRFVWNDA